MGLFQTLRQKDLARAIDEARNLVIYAAPGVSNPVANALLEAARRLKGAVVVILDASANTAWLGYGQFSEIERLHLDGIELLGLPGLRQSLLIVDNRGWAFTLPAGRVETDAPDQISAPNALELTQAQVAVLRSELPQPKPLVQEAFPEQPILPESIGAEPLTAEVVARVKRELIITPPLDIDLSRQVQTYTAFIRFVELKMNGGRAQSTKVKIPPDRLPVLATRDANLRDRLETQLKVLDEFEGGPLTKLRERVENLRARYCHSVGELGSVVLTSDQQELQISIDALEEDLDAARTEIIMGIDEALQEVLTSLTPEFVRAALAQPPKRLIERFGSQPSREQVERYVQAELSDMLPPPAKLVDRMSVRLTFKDVTYSALKDESFKERVFRQIPREKLPAGLLAEYDAVQRREQSGTKARG